MYGQTNSYDDQNRAVEEYVTRIDPYQKQNPLHFDLRSYARYVEEHDITPDQVTADMWERFKITECQSS